MKSSTKASNSSTGLVIGIDLGGTNMQIGVVDGRNRIIGRERRKTKARAGFAKTIDRIVEGVDAACKDAGIGRKNIEAIGIAAPGAVDIPRGIVLEAPNLQWKNVPLRRILTRKLGRPVVLDNDVNGAVWGEYKLGAGRQRGHGGKHRDVLGVWLGTGVGGGLVVGGELFHGVFFTAGEIGQTVLVPNGPKGRRIVEDFCSRTGMSRTIHERLKDHPRSFFNEVLTSKNQIINSSLLAEAYQGGDSLAVEVVNEAADLLGMVIANHITVLSLGLVIIGGGVTESLGESFLKKVRTSFKRYVFPKRCQKAELIMTELKDDAGLLGAALLARAGN